MKIWILGIAFFVAIAALYIGTMDTNPLYKKHPSAAQAATIK